MKSWSWNIFLYEEILHYSTLRSEWHGSVFYSRLGICFSGKIIFETQRLFIILMFLRKQSGNSLANWWSVCFKIVFSERIYLWRGFDRFSHRGGKLFLGFIVEFLYCGFDRLSHRSGNNFLFPDPDFDYAQPPKVGIIFFPLP